MSSAFYDDPNDYDFGLDFDYNLWTAGTTIKLLNVKWDNNYRDVSGFETKADLKNYIDGKAGSGITINDMSYVKPGQPIRINVPHNRAIRYNYLIASNPVQPIPGNDIQKDFYYFIVDAKYIAPNTTELTLQLDAWASFIHEVDFGMCYVERSHIGIANTNQMDSFGREYLTIPEGLDTGSDMEIVGIQRKNVGAMAVIAISTVDLTAENDERYEPTVAKSSMIQGMPSGAGYYAFGDYYQLQGFLDNHKTKPWVTQGIISLYIVPGFKEFFPDVTFDGDFLPTHLNNITPDGSTLIEPINMLSNWRSELNHIPARYAHLNKFKTSPYMALEMTAYSGNPIVIKPECWNTPHMQVWQKISVLMPNGKHAFWPYKYNAGFNIPVNPNFDTGEGYDHSTSFAEFPKTSIVNNMAISWLASNTNTIAYQRDAADWAQQRAIGAAQASYDIASGAMQSASDIQQIGVAGDADTTAVNNVNKFAQTATKGAFDTVAGGIGSTVFGPGAAAVGALSNAASALGNIAASGIDAAANNELFNIRSRTSKQTVDRQNQQSGLVRDTNRSIANWSARGDYASAISAINAKVQDSKMIQPSVSGQAGGAIFNYVNGLWYLDVKVKSIDKAAMRRVGEYWLRYGYAINQFIQPPQNLKVMSKFTYWKMLETYISSSTVPEGFKNVIRGILEKGTTVWSNPDEIGTIDIATNQPLTGISY